MQKPRSIPRPSVRQMAVPVTSVAVVAGMMFGAAPANAATTVTNFTSACVAGSVIGDQAKNVGASMTVDAPASVAPGEVFTYRIAPNASSYPDKESIATTTNVSRLKYDFELPANTEWVSGAVVPGTAVGIDNVAPNVLLVNDSGTPDASGRVIRLSGNNQVIGNSPSSSTSSEGGIRAPKTKKNLDGSTNSAGETWFRLPAIDVTVRAIAPGVITPRVRIEGTAATHGAHQAFSTSLARANAGFLGNQWAPTRCTPRDNGTAPLNAGAGPLATITVTDPGPTVDDTTTTLNVPATAKTGTAVDLTATVAPAGATGTVQFKDGGTDIGAPVAVNNGSATLNHTFTADGTHSITAVYSGDATHNPSTSSAGTVEVSTDIVVVDTTTTVNVPATAKTGTAVDLTANVAPAEATGTVEFKDGATILGSAPVNAGTATLNHTFTTDGTHSITAVYSGAEGFATSTSAAGTVEVSTDPVIVDSTIDLNVPASAKTGTEVSLAATLDPNTATGTVEFKDGTTVLGTAPVVNGVATLNHTFTTDGTHSITAVYSGDATHNPSTSVAANVEVSTDIVVVDTATTLNVPTTATTGAAVELKAIVSPTDASGTVEFRDGATVIGTAPVVNGVATLNHIFSTDGTHNITAAYSGDSTHNASTSDVATVDVSTDTTIPGGGSLENVFGS